MNKLLKVTLISSLDSVIEICEVYDHIETQVRSVENLNFTSDTY